MLSAWRGEALRREEAASLNLSEAFFHMKKLRDSPLAGAAEVGKVERIFPGVLKPRQP